MEMDEFLTFPPAMADVPWTKAESMYEKVMNSPGRNFLALLQHQTTSKVIDKEEFSALEVFRWAEILSNCEHTESRPIVPPDEVLLAAKERKVT